MVHAWMRSALTVAALAFIAAPLHAADTIKVGVPGAHSGDLVSYGQPSLHAAMIVADVFNEKGGVLGKKVEIIPQDDQCKPELGSNAATKLLSDGVDVIMGPICTGATKAALPVYTDAKKITLSPSATAPELTESGTNPYFFRTIASDSDQGHMAAKFIRDILKSKKVAMLHDKGDYGRGFTHYAEEVFKEAGIEVVLTEGITPGATDYTAVIQKVRRSKADVVLFGGYHPEGAKLVLTMKKRKLEIPFVSDDGIRDEAFLKVAGKEAEGMVYATSPKDVSKLPENITAHELHVKKFGVPAGAFYDNAYAASVALLTAIQNAGSTDTDKIMEALRTNYVDTPLGKIKFDAKGDAEGIGFSIYKVENGDFVEQKI